MFIRVTKKDGKWFRNDNGKLVGYEIVDENVLSFSKRLFGNQIFVINDNTIFTIYYGYINNGEFVPLCKDSKSTCDSCPWYKRTIFCRRRINRAKDKTTGYYISN